MFLLACSGAYGMVLQIEEDKVVSSDMWYDLFHINAIFSECLPASVIF